MSCDIRLPQAVEIPRWDITVEDWNEGERMVNYEEKFGHRTTEVYYTTKKTPLEFHDIPLAPWKDLPAAGEQLSQLAGEKPSMAHVSGIGTYRASFVLSDGWEGCGALLRMENAGGASVQVEVNGHLIPAVDTRTLCVDISQWIRTGENSLRIETASTLTNRMIQRNYQEKGSGWDESFPQVQEYGLTGKVEVLPYRMERIR